jgi:hypothetical protein
VRHRTEGSRSIQPHDWVLTRLALNDDVLIGEINRSEATNLAASEPDPRSQALVQMGALLASDASPAAYASVVRKAERAGVTAAEIAGVLVAVSPLIGIVRTVSAAPGLALALGFDVDDVLEGDRDRAERA